MSRPDPSINGNPPKPDLFELNLEPVDPAELAIDNVPLVEAVALRKPGFGFWKAFLWCVLATVVSQGTIGAIVTIAIFRDVFAGVPVPTDPALVFSTPTMKVALQWAIPIGHLASVIFCLLVLRYAVGKQWKRRIAFRLPSIEHVVLIVIAMPALLLAAIPIEVFVVQYVPSVKQFGFANVDDFVLSMRSWPWSMAVLAIGVGPALWEELWFRGFIGQGIVNRFGTFWGVLLSSFLFGAFHLEPPQAVMAFLLGIALHLSYLATRSLLIPMLMHFIINSLAVLAASDAGNVPLLGTLETAYSHRPLLAFAASILVLIAVSLALYRSRVTIRTPAGIEVPRSQYPHVEIPHGTSANRPRPEPLPALEVVSILVSVLLFTAVWFGF